MASITDFMHGDHQACDEAFAEAEDAVAKGNWAKGRPAFAAFQQAMDRHFDWEEGVLFPAFEDHTGMRNGPTAVMRSEHDQMRHTLEELARALEASDEDRFLGLCETLLLLMQQHNLKEESVLYPMMDQMMGAESAGLLSRLAAPAR
jgi:iron-sulfur cluster repair protein YtfE (RIC family)